MRKFWLLLLSIGLLMAFAMPAAAVDVKFSGSYYAQGWYVDNPSVLNKDNAPAGKTNLGANAFYSQRFRLTTEFQVVEGLKLVTRFDALEKRWGDQSWAGSTGETMSRMQQNTATGGSVSGNTGTVNTGVRIQENIEFERAYLDFNVPFGKFQVGYMEVIQWGTTFLNSTPTTAGIRYYYNQGPWMVIAATEKRAEGTGLNGGSNGTYAIGKANDADRDVYDLGAVYKFGAFEGGLLYQYIRSSLNKFPYSDTATAGGNNGYLTQLNILLPYAKAAFGNFFIEGEGMYGFGNLRAFDTNGARTTAALGASGTAAAQDVGVTSIGLFLHGKYDLKPAYVGAKFVYLSGDDNQNSDKVTGSILQSQQMNRNFYPTLILWNDDYQNNIGNIQGNIPTTATGTNRRTGQNYALRQEMDNVWFYQVYAGVKPTSKLDIQAALSIASADKKPKSDVGAVGSNGYYGGSPVTEFVSDQYGTELDLTATYKIYDNLTYMIGVGYLWTGDYFKGYDAGVQVSNNYLLSHKLTLNF